MITIFEEYTLTQTISLAEIADHLGIQYTSFMFENLINKLLLNKKIKFKCDRRIVNFMQKNEMDLPCRKYHTEVIGELGLENLSDSGIIYVKFNNFLGDPHIHRFSIKTPITFFELPDDMLEPIKKLVIKKNTKQFDL